MAEFKKNNRFSGSSGRSFGGARSSGGRPYDSRSSGGRDAGSREMFKASCASCQKETQVPFRPNGKKPVYCSDCFRKDEDRPQQNFREERSFAPTRPTYTAPAQSNDSGDIKRQLATMNATLEKLLAAVEAINFVAAPANVVQKQVSVEASEPVAPKKVARIIKKAAKKAK